MGTEIERIHIEFFNDVDQTGHVVAVRMRREDAIEMGDMVRPQERRDKAPADIVIARAVSAVDEKSSAFRCADECRVPMSNVEKYDFGFGAQGCPEKDRSDNSRD